MRLFLAIMLPPRVQHHVLELTSALKTTGIGNATWAEAKNLHLTVVFFGEVASGLVPSLTRELAKAAAQVPSFTVTLTQLAHIPRVPRVVALGVGAGQAFRGLQRAVALRATALGIRAELKSAHLTLARLTQPARSPLKAAFTPCTLKVAEVVLMESTPTPQGSRYRALKRFSLATGGEPGLFRPNVGICIVNPKGEALLLWHREHVKRYWQFLQGGVAAGETVAQAVTRELKEELGLRTFDILSIREDVYRYRWPKRLVEKGTDPDKQGYIGQLQSLAIVRVREARPALRPDAREAASTKWFPIPRFVQALNPVRRTLGRLAMVELRRLGLAN